MLMFGGRRVEIGVGNGKEVRDHVGVHMSANLWNLSFGSY
jgi:hypothetical protein